MSHISVAHLFIGKILNHIGLHAFIQGFGLLVIAIFMITHRIPFLRIIVESCCMDAEEASLCIKAALGFELSNLLFLGIHLGVLKSNPLMLGIVGIIKSFNALIRIADLTDIALQVITYLSFRTSFGAIRMEESNRQDFLDGLTFYFSSIHGTHLVGAH